MPVRSGPHAGRRRTRRDRFTMSTRIACSPRTRPPNACLAHCGTKFSSADRCTSMRRNNPTGDPWRSPSWRTTNALELVLRSAPCRGSGPLLSAIVGTRSRISCFRHGCGLRDAGAIAPFARGLDPAPHHVCARRGFDLRGAARISVNASSIDDICKAEFAMGSPTSHEWDARLLHS